MPDESRKLLYYTRHFTIHRTLLQPMMFPQQTSSPRLTKAAGPGRSAPSRRVCSAFCRSIALALFALAPGSFSPLFSAETAPLPTAPLPTATPPTVAPRDGYTTTPLQADGKWHVHDPDRPYPPVITPGANFSQAAPAPSDAEILFNGNGLAAWVHPSGGEPTWKTSEDYMESAPKSGGLRTRGRWADFQLHVEWASPTPPQGKAQGRGNSGVIINNLYEVQVLDSYESSTYADGQVGRDLRPAAPLGKCQQAARRLADLRYHL